MIATSTLQTIRLSLSTRARVRGSCARRFLASTPDVAPQPNDNGTATAPSPAALPNETPRGIFRLLGAKERALLSEQQTLTQLARRIAREVGSVDVRKSENRRFLEEFQLDSTFAVVIAGEFNAGKSTLVNALLGQKMLDMGALPTTDCITIVSNPVATSPSVDSIHADTQDGSDATTPTKQQQQRERTSLPSGVVLHRVAKEMPLLHDLTLIDTPGTNAVLTDHTARTLRLLPAADLLLFVTSADRPFPDSERTLLKSIQAFRRNIVIVINKMDILDSAGGDHGKEQKQQVVDFVTHNASELLGARPIVLPISSRDALTAKVMTHSSGSKSDGSAASDGEERSSNLGMLWERSHFESLESFLKDTLTAETKLKSKLTNPLGVIEGIIAECLQKLEHQQKDLEADVATLNIFQSQFNGWKNELQADLATSRRDVSNMLTSQGERCSTLLDQTSWLDLYRISFDQSAFDKAWKDTRSISTAQSQQTMKDDLLDQVRDTADSVATRGRAQGQAVIEYLGKRPAMQNQSLIGSVTSASRFEDTRKSLEERLSNAVVETMDFDETEEVGRVFESLRSAAMVSAGLQIGALGSVGLAAMQSLDVIAASSSALAFVVTGGAWLYSGTTRIRGSYQQTWKLRASRLDAALEEICSKELERVNRRILDGVAPYTRFVETEQERTSDLVDRCEGVLSSSKNLRRRIGKL